MTAFECPSCRTQVDVPDDWTAEAEVAAPPGATVIPHCSVWGLHKIGPQVLLHECFYGTPDPKPQHRTRPNGTMISRAFFNAEGDTTRLEATLFPPS